MSTEEMIEYGQRHRGQQAIIELARNAHRNACLAYEGRQVNSKKFQRSIDYVIKAARAHRVLVAAGGQL